MSFSITIRADKAGLADYLAGEREKAVAAAKAAKPGSPEVSRQNGIAAGLDLAITVITTQWQDTGKAEPGAGNGQGDRVIGYQGHQPLARSSASPRGDDPRPGAL